MVVGYNQFQSVLPHAIWSELSVTEAAVSVFLSYSRKDKDLLDSFRVHLAGLVNTEQITTWHDRDIEAGNEWEPAIQQQLNSAKIIILLISANFIASEYCYGNELKRAIERHDAQEAHVIPVILKPCLWNLPKIPFSKLNVLPNDALPVTRWQDPDEAFTVVVEHIAKIVDRLGQDRQRQQDLEQQRILQEQEAERQRRRNLEQQRQEAERQRILLEQQAEELQRQKRAAQEAESQRHLLEQQNAKQQQSEIDKLELASERGVDYSKLLDLLKAGKWKEADEETLKVMLKAANREKNGWLNSNSLRNFPCKDLKTIDQLWVTASNGHFGFSVQKKIWEKCGSPMSYNVLWEKFGDAVGWRVKGEWLDYYDLKFAPAPEGFSPDGELPWGGVGLVEVLICYSFLAQRLVNCSIPQS